MLLWSDEEHAMRCRRIMNDFISKYFRYARNRHNVTQKAVAQECNIQQSMVSRFESGGSRDTMLLFYYMEKFMNEYERTCVIALISLLVTRELEDDILDRYENDSDNSYVNIVNYYKDYVMNDNEKWYFDEEDL